jgi:hypothetical protein
MAVQHTYRRWLVAMTLGELVPFAVPTAVSGSGAAAGLGDQATYVPVVIAGAGEGAVLGYAQTRVLRGALPALARARGCARPRPRVRSAGRWASRRAPSTTRSPRSRPLSSPGSARPVPSYW